MSELPPRTINAIYHPVLDLDWLTEATKFTAEEFSGTAQIDSPIERPFIAQVINRTELHAVTLPVSRDADYVATQIRAAMPPSFENGLEVITKGAMYTAQKEWNKRTPLLVKLEAMPELVKESDVAYEILCPYGLVPEGMGYFNIFIGAVNLRNLDSQAKQKLRFGITDRIPKTLKLGPGVIDIPRV